VGSRRENGVERPRAVSEYLVERMIAAGVDRLCFVISPAKADILQYYGSRLWGADIAYVVQPAPGGLCDATFRAAPLIRPDEPVIIGLPDTIWFPSHALASLPEDVLSLLLFPVRRPDLFDAVSTDEHGHVQQIHVKQRGAPSRWIWGAIKMPGHIFHALHELWQRPERGDEYLGTLINAWLAEGGRALGVQAGRQYVDTGTLDGYRAAIRMLDDAAASQFSSFISDKEARCADESITADRR
jgi:dTDP-glucose pyrophosphorylase